MPVGNGCQTYVDLSAAVVGLVFITDTSGGWTFNPLLPESHVLSGVRITTQVVTFVGGTLPSPYSSGAVGKGDKLTIGDQVFYVLSRLSPAQVRVQQPATEDLMKQPYRIERAYHTLREWESGRQGNLVVEARREVGVAYNDGPFHAGVIIEGSRTDSNHYMQLTVAEGQRHIGSFGIGVTVQPVRDGDVFVVRDDHFKIDWFEIKGWKGDSAAVSVRANHTSYRNLLVHDGADPESDGFRLLGDKTERVATIANSIILRAPRAGLHVNNGKRNASLVVYVQNLSIVGCGTGTTARAGPAAGIVNTAGAGSVSTVHAENVVAVGNKGADFLAQSPETGFASWGESRYNLSSDDSAPGPQSQKRVAPEDVFISVRAGHDNLHIRENSPAKDTGLSLWDAYLLDIDGESRPEADWDRGADEVHDYGAEPLGLFHAAEVDGEIFVQWQTDNERPGLRFVLFRAGDPTGPWTRIQDLPEIPGLAASSGKTIYFYHDGSPRREENRYYAIEVSRAKGKVTRYGPVSPRLRAESESADLDPSELPFEGAQVGIAYGVPGATSLQVVNRNQYQVTLELTVGGIFATIDRTGSVSFHLPGAEKDTVRGSHSLPVLLARVNGHANAVELGLVRSQAIVSFSGLTLTKDTSHGGGADGNAGRGSSPARIVRVESQGTASTALVELAPLRWNPASEVLALSRRILIRLTFPEHVVNSDAPGPDRPTPGARRP